MAIFVIALALSMRTQHAQHAHRSENSRPYICLTDCIIRHALG
jgi:hypothetical protein